MKHLIWILLLLAPVAVAQTRYNNGTGSGLTASDTASLSARIDTKLNAANFTDSAAVHGAGLATLAKGQPVFAGGADTMYSAYQVVPIFSFGYGSGAAGDTTACVNTSYFGSFYNKTDTLVITSLMCVLKHGVGTDTIGVQVSWDDTLGGTATVLNTAAYPVNSITTGNEDTAFNNAAIPPGMHVWGSIPTVVAGRKPTMAIWTISGYFRKAR